MRPTREKFGIDIRAGIPFFCLSEKKKFCQVIFILTLHVVSRNLELVSSQHAFLSFSFSRTLETWRTVDSLYLSSQGSSEPEGPARGDQLPC